MKTSCLHLQYKYCVPHLCGYKIRKQKKKKKLNMKENMTYSRHEASM